MEKLKTKVFESLGEASMCWSESPKGEFQSEEAKRIGNELIEMIKPLIKGLEEIAEPSGAYSVDPLQHANNTIENCKKIAKDLLSSIS
jgi:hypothetical protein